MSYEQKKDIVPAVKMLRKKNLMIWPNQGIELNDYERNNTH